MKYATAAILGAGLIGGLTYQRLHPRSDDQLVLRFERSGPSATQDRDLVAYLAGSDPPSTETVVTAYCASGPYWARNVIVDLDIVVGGTDRLLRAAELVADGSYPTELVTAIESASLRALEPPPVDIGEIPESIVATYGRTPVLNYLVDANESPSAESRERFVLFAASETTSNQFIFVIDSTKLDRAAIGRFIDGEPRFGGNADDVVIAGTGDTISVDAGMCQELR